MNGQRVAALEPAAQPGGDITLTLDNGAVLKSRSVIIATGARWKNVNVPGEAEYRTKGVAYCPHCDGPLFKGKKVAVIGGGNSGVEAAIDLAGVVEHVTLLEFADQLKADAVLVNKLRSLPNVSVHTSAMTTEITGDGSKVDGLRFKDRTSGQEQHIALAGVFVQIGLVPNTDFLKGTLELSRYGEVIIDERCHTSLPGVFAAGDVTTVPYKQIIIAGGEGAKAALSAFDHLIRTPRLKLLHQVAVDVVPEPGFAHEAAVLMQPHRAPAELAAGDELDGGCVVVAPLTRRTSRPSHLTPGSIGTSAGRVLGCQVASNWSARPLHVRAVARAHQRLGGGRGFTGMPAAATGFVFGGQAARAGRLHVSSSSQISPTRVWPKLSCGSLARSR